MFLVLAFAAIRSTVDFSTKPFEPLRQQWDLSTQKVTGNEFYQQNIVTLQSKVCPVVSQLQEKYVTPSYGKVNSFVVGKYRALLADRLSLISDQVFASSIYQNYGDKVVALYKQIGELSKHYAQLVFENFARGVVNSTKGAQILYAYVVNNTRVLVGKIENFTKNSFIPTLLHAKQATVKYSIVTKEAFVEKSTIIVNGTKKQSIFALEQVKKFSLIGYFKTVEFFHLHVCPFVATQITPRVQHFHKIYIQKYYDLYLKSYVDVVRFHAEKYCTLFRVNQILKLSKSLLSSSYDQLNQQFAKFTKVEELSTVLDTPKTARVTVAETTDFSNTEAAETVQETPAASEEVEPEIPEEVVVSPETEEQKEVGVDAAVQQDEDESEKEVVLSLTDEITNWEGFIDETIASIFKSFENSIADLEKAVLGKLQPEITARLQKLSKELNYNYSEVNKLIYNIDSHPAALENGDEVYLDKEGKIIDHEISREEFRALLNSNKDFASSESDSIHEYLVSHVKELESTIDAERKLIVDIYEEFAEVSINEFSKKMMYSTYANSFKKIAKNADAVEEETENFSDWKQYIQVKNRLIQQRDELISKQFPLTELNKYLKEIQFTLKSFIHEAGDYYAILRAKANIEFQQREGRNAALEKQLAGDEDVTIKSTVIKTVTVVDDAPEATEAATVVDVPQRKVVRLEDLQEQQQVLKQEQETTEPVVEGTAAEAEDAVPVDSEQETEEEITLVQESTVGSAADDTETAEQIDIVEHQEDEAVNEKEESVEEEEDIVKHQPDEQLE